MKFKIEYNDMIDEIYPFNPSFSVEMIDKNMKGAIKQFKECYSVCIIIDIKEIE